VNFWLSKDDFLAALESAGLQPSLIAAPWQPHHFYRCRRLPAAFDP
jgi:hypothetical protein